MAEVVTVLTHQGQAVIIAEVVKGHRDQTGQAGGEQDSQLRLPAAL